MTTKRIPPYSPDVRVRAVHMELDYQSEHVSQSAAINSIASKIGCSGETLRNWIQQSGQDKGVRTGPTSDERIRGLKRESRKLRRANNILREASAYFAMAELDRGSRT
jgi:transposase